MTGHLGERMQVKLVPKSWNKGPPNSVILTSRAFGFNDSDD